MPGEKSEHDEGKIKKQGAEESSDFFVRFVIISQDSSFKKMWTIIYLFSCFTTPYVYAWFALNGHQNGKTPETLASYVFESIFALNIFFNFVTDYTADGEIIAEKDISKIADRYIHKDFLQDFIPTFPLTFFFDNTPDHFWRLFYLIKTIRLIKGIEIYDVQVMMNWLKEKNTQRVMKNVENDPTLLQNLDMDQNNIDFLFNVRYALKISKLFLIIINVAYFTGVIWMIFC